MTDYFLHWTMLERLWLCWHVLRGRSVLYRCRVTAGGELSYFGRGGCIEPLGSMLVFRHCEFQRDQS